MAPGISVLFDGIDHAEDVTWDPSGRLLAGTESGDILALDLATARSTVLASTGGFALGMALDGSGGIHLCDMSKHAVFTCGPDGSGLRVESSGTSERPMAVPNYPAYHPSGILFVSDSGTSWDARDGGIFAIAPDGGTVVASEESRDFPNGLAVDPGGDYLYVAESSDPRISRFPVDGPRLGPRQDVIRLPGTVPDGLAFTEHGDLIVTCYRPDRIFLLSAGELTVLADDPQGRFLAAPTNVAFFGDSLERLAVANIGARFVCELQTGLRGAPVHRPRI